MPIKSPNNNQVRYPVTIDLKVIMFSDTGHARNVYDLDKILEKLLIPLKKDWRISESSAGKYFCYTGTVYIVSKDILYALFEELKKHPNVKFAI